MARLVVSPVREGSAAFLCMVLLVAAPANTFNFDVLVMKLQCMSLDVFFAIVC